MQTEIWIIEPNEASYPETFGLRRWEENAEHKWIYGKKRDGFGRDTERR